MRAVSTPFCQGRVFLPHKRARTDEIEFYEHCFMSVLSLDRTGLSDLRFEFLSKSNLLSLWWGIIKFSAGRRKHKCEIDSRSLFVNDLVVFGFPALKFQVAVLPAKFL